LTANVLATGGRGSIDSTVARPLRSEQPDWEHARLSERPESRLRRLLGRGLGELYRLRREFGRREYTFEIVPGSQVEVTAPGGFHSVGDDPQLELVPTGGKYPYGLVTLRHQLESDVDEATLFFDVGSGYGPSGQVSIPSGVHEVIVALPPDVRGLRLDPRESPGPFRLSGVTITEISIPGLLGQRGLVLARSVAEPRRLRALLGSALQALRTRGLPSVARVPVPARPAGQERTYPRWLRRYGTFTEEERRRARVAIETWQLRPRISVVMPVFNAPEGLLARAIESVRAQVYENWELCIADDASTDPAVGKVLAAFAAQDARIRPKLRERNGHIVEATNSALADVAGEFVVFLDHDDEFTPDALALVVNALNRWPETDLLYSDEDKLDEQGERFDPAFKPRWSPELLLAQNYVCHLLAIRTALIRKVGGMRPGFEGSQDHDLVLRLSEIISTDRIRHLPFVLYHWRRSSGSTATSEDAKPYAGGAGVLAVKEALQRRGLRAEVAPGRAPYSYRVRYALPAPLPRVSIIIPTRDGLDLLRTCISTVQKETLYGDYEMIVVDNDSGAPETLEYLAELDRSKQARVLRYRGPFNFSAINNFAAARATGSVLVLLNNDIEVVSAEWLREMVSLAVQRDVGAVGGLLLYPDGRIQHAGVVTGMGGVAGHAYKREPGTSWGRSRELTVRREVSAVTAACLAVERAKFDRVGGLDAEHLPVAFNDVEFCLKLREAGFRNLWTPHAVLRHHESVSRGSDERPERRAAFQAETAYMKKKWGNVLLHDPFFSPNYTLEYEIPQLALPPRVTPFYREGPP
jgi:O-antigen biosynthesis protein